MTVCHLLECVHNDRGNQPQCQDEPEISNQGSCLRFKTDHDYLRAQFRQRHGWGPKWIEMRNFENMVTHNASSLRRILRGETATKVLTGRMREILHTREILVKEGRFLEVSPRAMAILEANGLIKNG